MSSPMPVEARMPDLTHDKLDLARVLGASVLVMVYIGLPLSLAAQAFVGSLKLGAVVALVLSLAAGWTVLSILRRTARPRTIIHLGGRHASRDKTTRSDGRTGSGGPKLSASVCHPYPRQEA